MKLRSATAPRLVSPSDRRVTIRFLDVAIVVLAFTARIYHLGSSGLDFDEAFGVQAGFKSFPDLLNLLATVEPHPPFYYSFVHLWAPLAGTTGFALRFPSLAANVLTIALLIRLADWLGWRSAGRVGAILYAVNPFQVWYSQEARMYAPVALFGLAALWFGLHYYAHGRTRSLVLSAVFMLLALATHYYAIFLFLFANLLFVGGIFFDRHPGQFSIGEGGARTSLPNGKLSRMAIWRWLAAQTILGVVLVAWLAYASRVSTGYVRTLPGALSLWSTVKDSLVDYSVGTSIPYSLGTWLALGFLGVVVAGGWMLLRGESRNVSRRFRAASLVGYLLFPLALGFLVSLVRELYEPRYLMVSAPAFFLALGLGVVALGRVARPLGIGATLFLLGAELVSLHNAWTDPQYDKAELAGAITYVQRHLSPGDSILLDGFGQTTVFWYYNNVQAARPAPWDEYPFTGPDGPQSLATRLDAIMARQRGIWLLDYGVQITDPARTVETYLAQNYFQAYYHVVLKNRVVYYLAPPAAAPTVTALDDSCNGQLLLKDFQSYATRATAGEILPLALEWQAIGPARPDYVVSWRLIDSAGHVVTQRDAEPSAGFSPTSSWRAGDVVVDREGLLVPASLPPGPYSLAIVVYEKASGDACAFVHGATPIPGATLPLEQLTVSDAMPRSTFETVAPSHPARATIGGLTFLGSDLESGPYRPGDRAAVRLDWRVDRQPAADGEIEERLVSATGDTLLDARVPLGPAQFPTSRWQSGREVSTYVDVPIPVDASSGSDRLDLTLLLDGADSLALPGLPDVQVVARPHRFTLPSLSNPVSADFAGLAQLRGYDLALPLPDAVQPGQPIHLTLYWQDEEEMPGSYTVFTHLVGPDGKIYGQNDAIPLDGVAPTNGWVSGEVLADAHDLVVSPNAPPGQYQLSVGLYDAETGQRLALTGAETDNFTLTTVTVVAPST